MISLKRSLRKVGARIRIRRGKVTTADHGRGSSGAIVANRKRERKKKLFRERRHVPIISGVTGDLTNSSRAGS